MHDWRPFKVYRQLGKIMTRYGFFEEERREYDLEIFQALEFHDCALAGDNSKRQARKDMVFLEHIGMFNDKPEKGDCFRLRRNQGVNEIPQTTDVRAHAGVVEESHLREWL